MENRFRNRISRIFTGSFRSSCWTRNLSDVVENSLFLPHQHNHNTTTNCDFPTICRTTLPESAATQVITHCTIPYPKIDSNTRCYPPTGGLLPSDLTRWSYYEKKRSFIKHGNKKMKKKKQSTGCIFSSPSRDSAYYSGRYYWYSSDDDEERKGDANRQIEDKESDILFFSSDSTSDLHRHYRRRNTSFNSQRKQGDRITKNAEKVKGSFAVVKSSNNPYQDFKKSMLEMMVAKQLYAAKDLEQLLQCFLSLNSDHHHVIIVQVFMDIWGNLFSTCGFDS
ncbi:Transcription repressor OFP8 [Linum perenne]